MVLWHGGNDWQEYSLLGSPSEPLGAISSRQSRRSALHCSDSDEVGQSYERHPNGDKQNGVSNKIRQEAEGCGPNGLRVGPHDLPVFYC